MSLLMIGPRASGSRPKCDLLVYLQGIPQVGLQLHATVDDLVALVTGWPEDEQQKVAALKQSSRWMAVTSDGPESTRRELASAELIRVSTRNRGQPDEAKPDFEGDLVIQVGPLTDEGLRESAIGAIAADFEALRPWRRFIRRTQTAAHSGATVINPETGARQHLPSHRHLEGAHDLAANGLPMLAAAGWNVYEFDDLS